MKCMCKNSMMVITKVNELTSIYWCETCGRAVAVYDINNTTKTGTDMNWFVPRSVVHP